MVRVNRTGGSRGKRSAKPENLLHSISENKMGSLLACSSAMMSLRVSLLGQNLTFVLFLTLLYDFIGLARFLLQLQYFGGIYLKPLNFLEHLDNMN